MDCDCNNVRTYSTSNIQPAFSQWTCQNLKFCVLHITKYFAACLGSNETNFLSWYDDTKFFSLRRSSYIPRTQIGHILNLAWTRGNMPLGKPWKIMEDNTKKKLQRYRAWLYGRDSSDSRKRPLAGFYEYSGKNFRFRKTLRMFEQPTDCWLLKKEFCTWNCQWLTTCR
jgi:hypothetical protein